MTQFKTTKTVLVGGAAALLLSACSTSDSSSSGGTVTTPDVSVTMGAASAAVQNRVSSLPGSAFAAVPTSGSATFTGTGVVTMVLSEADNQNFRAMGTSTVVVTFAEDNEERITGGLSNLMGAVGTEAEVNAAIEGDDLFAVGGAIELSRLNIYERETGLSNRFGVSYGGTLTAGGTDYVVAGRQEGGVDLADGTFDGNRFNGTFVAGTPGVRLRAIQIEDSSDTFATVTDGDAISVFEGSIGIYGENR